MTPAMDEENEGLLSAYHGMTVAIAEKYDDRGVALPDLVNAGTRGLIRAAEKFDPDGGYGFRSFAAFWIRHEIIAEFDGR